MIAVSCAIADDYVSLSGGVWNTTYSIKYRGSMSLADSVQAVMRDVELSLSPFNESSVISAVNANRSMLVDSNIVNVFELSQRVNEQSGGAFDPTLSPLINLWGFGYERHEKSVPADSLIDAAMSSVGIAQCRLEEMSMIKKSPETTFNFSAVTKGYGCDMVAAMLRRNGVTDYMVEIGGELSLGGVNDRGKSWRVMVDAPVESVSGHKGLAVIELTGCAVATSGNYRNFRETDAGRVWHTISATTGRPMETNVLSATVVAPDCATADAFATACMAMDCADALKMVESVGRVECLLVTGAADSMSIVTTAGFPDICR